MLFIYLFIYFYFFFLFCDLILHSALLYKLAMLDINGRFHTIIHQIYQENKLHVRVQDKLILCVTPK